MQNIYTRAPLALSGSFFNGQVYFRLHKFMFEIDFD